ncbi:MAG TPA: hypothetical protein VFB01_18410 [Burkholderiales bacterium]|nr:hypothetical protein [Burkholderiales bacterium]
MRLAPEQDVEALLQPQVRALLPFSRLLLLYLNPFALFKDASRGNVYAQRVALAYNRALRWILLRYLRRWTMIAAALFVSIAPAEALAAQAPVFVLSAAASAVGCCIAVTVIVCTVATYVMLGRRD